MTEPARPIDVSNIMSTRALAILRTFGSAFAALDDFRQKGSSAEAATIVAAIVKHVRSSDPMAAISVPSMEMPVIASPVVAPVVEAQQDIERALHDEHSYRISHGIYDGEELIAFGVADGFEHALIHLTPTQAEQLQADIAAVRAAVRRG